VWQRLQGVESLWAEDQEPSVQLGNLGRLRRKLEEPPIIEALPGFGYRIAWISLGKATGMVLSRGNNPRKRNAGWTLHG
jgi:hypothetical protein